MDNKDGKNTKKTEQVEKRANVHILSEEEQEKQLALLHEQILQHKDLFIRLRDK